MKISQFSKEDLPKAKSKLEALGIRWHGVDHMPPQSLGALGSQGRESPLLLPPHIVSSTDQSHCCPRLGLVSDTVAQGLPKGERDSACVAKFQVEMHAGPCPPGLEEGSGGTFPVPPPAPQRASYSPIVVGPAARHRTAQCRGGVCV